MSRAIYLSLAFLLCSVALVAQESGLPIAAIYIGPPDSLDFVGNPDSLAFKRRELINLMRLEAPGLLSGGTPFSRRALQIDAITINNFYISHGYLEADVAESFTTTADERIEIYLRISEGRQFMLSDLTITGNRLMTREEITQFLNIQIGEPYNRVNIRNQIEALRQHYQNQGKLTIDIVAEEDVIEDGVHLRLSISEGATYSLRDIKVIGLENIPEWYVMRELRFEQGDIFSLDRLDQSQQRIFESGLFSSVEITPLVVGPGTADIEVRVRELGRGSFDFSAGFSQIEAAAGGEPSTALSSAFQWWHFRVFNTSLRTGITLEGNLNWEDLWPPDFLAAWDFVSPWTLGIRIPSSLRIYADYRTTPKKVWRRGIDLSLTSRRTQRHQPQASIGWVLIDASGTNPDSIAVGTERGFRLEYLYQGADNMINPQRGIIFQVQYSFQRTFLPGQPFYQQVELDYRRYQSLTRNSVFAYRLKVGFLGTIPGDEILSDYHLFDLGGSTSLRGWANPGAFSTEGGMAKWLVNMELRFPLFWILSSELFIDAGGLNAFIGESDPDYDPDQPVLEWVTGWDTGLGLLISTPLGPIRLNAAVPLRGDQPGKTAYQVAFLHTF